MQSLLAVSAVDHQCSSLYNSLDAIMYFPVCEDSKIRLPF